MPSDVKPNLTPKLRFPEFRDAEGWKVKTLGQLCAHITNGKANAEDHEDGGAFPLFDRSETIKRSSEFMFDAEAVILPGEGMKFQPKYFKGKFNLHQRAYALMQCQGNAKFVYYALDGSKDRLAQNAVLSTVLSLRLPIVENFAVCAPEPDEQQKVAECLSTLDELIGAESQKLDGLKAHKKGLMQQIFPREGETFPRLRFPEFLNAGEWEVGPFDNLIEVIDGDRGANYPKAEEFSQLGFCLFLNAKNVTKTGFKFEELQFVSKEKDQALRKGKLKRADVILTTRGTVGQFAYYSKEIPYEHIRINSGMVILRIKKKEILPDYLYSFTGTEALNSYIKNIAFGNAQQQLTVGEIKKFQLQYPGPEEQQRIANCLFLLDDLITAQSDKLEALKTHKKGLMQQLFPTPTEAEA